MFAQLGDIRFQGIFSPNSFEKDAQTVFAEHALIGGKPRLQKTGLGADTVRLAMKLHRNFCTPEDEIDRLDSYRVNGESVRYITGTGRLIGTFVISSLKVTNTAQGPNGLLIEADIEVSLLENAGGDLATEAASAAIAAGFAMANNVPVEVTAPLAPLSAIGTASLGTLEINAATGALAADLDAAQANSNLSASALLEARATVQSMVASATSSVAAVNTTVLDVYDQTRFYEQNAQEMLTALDAFEAAVNDNDLLAAVEAFIPVTNANAALMTSAEVLERFNGARLPILTNG